MIRKLVLALGASAVIGAAALSPTAALAKHWHHHHHWYGGGIALYPDYYAESDCYMVKRVYWWHHTRHVRYEQVCD
jgi:hypothetical protein